MTPLLSESPFLFSLLISKRKRSEITVPLPSHEVPRDAASHTISGSKFEFYMVKPVLYYESYWVVTKDTANFCTEKCHEFSDNPVFPGPGHTGDGWSYLIFGVPRLHTYMIPLPHRLYFFLSLR